MATLNYLHANHFFIKFIRPLFSCNSYITITKYPIVQPVIYTGEVNLIYIYIHGVHHQDVILFRPLG